MTDAALDAKITFLEHLGADAAGHSDGSLLDHLRQTRAILERWGARPAVCDAGLFHSVYGTHAYAPAIATALDRAALATVIGEEAEQLAYQFGVMHMQRFWDNADPGAAPGIFERASGAWIALNWARIEDLATLVLANHVEQRPRLPGLPWPAPRWQLKRLVGDRTWRAFEQEGL